MCEVNSLREWNVHVCERNQWIIDGAEAVLTPFTVCVCVCVCVGVSACTELPEPCVASSPQTRAEAATASSCSRSVPRAAHAQEPRSPAHPPAEEAGAGADTHADGSEHEPCPVELETGDDPTEAMSARQMSIKER